MNFKEEIVVPIGKKNDKEIVYLPLNNILVGGLAGSGKSVYLQNLISFLKSNYDEDNLKFVLIDTSGYQFISIKDKGNLFCEAYRINDDIKAYLNTIIEENNNRLKGNVSVPKIIVVIDDAMDILDDEFNIDIIENLMSQSEKTGIYFALFTQRPNYYSNKLQQNMPIKIAMRLINEKESINFIGESGAEKLNGYKEIIVQYNNSNEKLLSLDILKQ